MAQITATKGNMSPQLRQAIVEVSNALHGASVHVTMSTLLTVISDMIEQCPEELQIEILDSLADFINLMTDRLFEQHHGTGTSDTMQ